MKSTIILRSGNKRKGEIIFQCPTYIVVIIGAREVTLPRTMIREIL